MAKKQENDRIFFVCATSDFFVRSEMEAELKEFLRDLILRLRQDKGYTQAKMAEALVMSERAYEYLENGDTSCGVLTTILIVLGMDERDKLLDDLRARLTRAYEKVGAMV